MDGRNRISIHALLAESDHPITVLVRVIENFYPRSPCGERLVKNRPRPSAGIFLSTLSLRRATPAAYSFWTGGIDFYPRSPCGERHGAMKKGQVYYIISIHALLAESDASRTAAEKGTPLFLSTLSLRRATVGLIFFLVLYHYFYPRSPCGERLESHQ